MTPVGLPPIVAIALRAMSALAIHHGGRMVWLACVVLLAGCNGASVRSQSPEQADQLLAETKLVGDLAASSGMHMLRLESVALVTGLANTGSDPPPSVERSSILADMQTRGVDSPNKVLASPSTSVAIVTAYLRPGIQKGDHFDVELRVPTRSETTSLRDGWLMECRLKEMAVLDGLREGFPWGAAQGAILVDPTAAADDKLALTRGRVLGGGICTKPRPVGLVLKPDHRSVPKSSLVGQAINQRFHTYHNGTKKGVATPQNDEYITLLVHPRYKDNVARYMQVVRAIALRESSLERLNRLKLLEKQLLDPVTADTAALRLEAIGPEALPTLKKGLESSDPLVKFYAAEALAYLDDSAACAALADAARNERAFRLFALTALSTMTDYDAYEALQGLLDSQSTETRYGAFRALWAMNDRDPLVRGEKMGDDFSLHVLEVPGTPLVHVTHHYRAEVVMFGREQRLTPPMVLDAGKNILVQADEDAGEITVTHFKPNEGDEQRTTSTRLDDVIRTVAKLGGRYPDVVQMLQQAKASGVLSSRLEVDAVPEAGRTYYLDDEQAEGESSRGVEISQPVPDLFPKLQKPQSSPAKSAESSPEGDGEAEEGADEAPRRRRFLGKLRG